MSQMYLTLPSNSSMQYFPGNRLCNFTTRLASKLNLGEGDWEVGLAEIQYPHNWDNVDVSEGSEETRVILWNGPGLGENAATLRGRYFANVPDLVKAVDDQVKRYARFEWDNVAGRVTVRITPKRGVTLPVKLSGILALPRTLNNPRVTSLEIEGEEIMDKNLDLNTMYVYCDLVRHNLLGDSSVPLLRVVHIRGKHGSYVSRAYENIMYQPMRRAEVQTVEIDIRDDTGESIPFNSGRVVVILHIRRSPTPHFQL